MPSSKRSDETDDGLRAARPCERDRPGHANGECRRRLRWQSAKGVRRRAQTSEFWTTADAPSRHASRQPLYVLTSAMTLSGAEDFSYSLESLRRVVLVGEVTGGGAHSGRGLVRLSPSFTAFLPVGRSVSPVTRTNWEGVGVKPDINAPADTALNVAHLHALGVLVEREPDPQWKQVLLQAIADLSKG